MHSFTRHVSFLGHVVAAVKATTTSSLMALAISDVLHSRQNTA